MTEEIIKFPIRSALIPVFYQNFHCIAQDCRDNCCVNWKISFNKKDYLRLRRLDAPKELRKRLETGVRRWKSGNHEGIAYGEFDMDSNMGRCPFLDGDGLCEIQRACGHDVLPDVCRNYPRKVKYSPAAKEYAMSPSCEGVLQQLWDLPEGVEFVENPLPKSEWRSVSIRPRDNLLMFFAPVRGLFIDILQNRDMPLTERMLCLGVIIQRLQNEDWNGFDPDSWEEQAALLAGSETLREMTANIQGNRDMFIMQNLNVTDEITKSEKAWTEEIYKALEVERKLKFALTTDPSGTEQNAMIVTNYSKKAYEDALRQFRYVFSDYEYFFENLMVAAALFLDFPQLKSKEELWKSYVSLCNTYSFYRFAAVLGCKDECTKERLFHMIAMASRSMLHNWRRFEGFQEQLFEHDSSTLAHMMILLRWD